MIMMLMISAIVLILAVGMSEANLSVMKQYLNNESNNTIFYEAESCLEEALVRLEEDTSFTSTTILFGTTECSATVSGTAPNMVINVSVTYGEYSQNYSANILLSTNNNANNVTLLNWQEI